MKGERGPMLTGANWRQHGDGLHWRHRKHRISFLASRDLADRRRPEFDFVKKFTRGTAQASPESGI